MVMTGQRGSAARELLDEQNMNTLVQKCVFGSQSQGTYQVSYQLINEQKKSN